MHLWFYAANTAIFTVFQLQSIKIVTVPISIVVVWFFVLQAFCRVNQPIDRQVQYRAPVHLRPEAGGLKDAMLS